jgi:hypothetical protein
MADTTDVLLHTMEQSWTQARQAEDQRAFLTNLIVLIAAADYGVLTQTGFVPLTMALIILDLYGAIASEKFYERYRHYIYRAGEMRKREISALLVERAGSASVARSGSSFSSVARSSLRCSSTAKRGLTDSIEAFAFTFMAST